jgi:hypothetical protein
MTPIGPLLHHENYHLRMVAVHHAWALMYLRRRETWNAALQFRAARQRLEEARTRDAIDQLFFEKDEAI